MAMNTNKRPRQKHRKEIVAGVIILSLVVVAVFYFNSTEQLPEKLEGIWTTTHPKYEGRYFKLEAKTIVFGTGGFNIDVYFIEDIEKTASSKGTVFVLNCQNSNNDPYRFAFVSSTGKPDEIRFQHQQQIVWHKNKAKPFS